MLRFVRVIAENTVVDLIKTKYFLSSPKSVSDGSLCVIRSSHRGLVILKKGCPLLRSRRNDEWIGKPFGSLLHLEKFSSRFYQ